MLRFLLLACVTFFSFDINLQGQPQETAPDTYILFLKDKKHNTFDIKKPETFLSARALTRRTKQGLKIDSTDLPVSTYYVDSLKKFGLKIYNTSRWFNSVTFKTQNTTIFSALNKISFVRKTEKTKPLAFKINQEPESYEISGAYDSIYYGFSYNQIHVHNGDYLHQNGFKGEKMLIAVIDAGFMNYKTVDAFLKIRSEGRILSIRDFVSHDHDVNKDNAHGMEVFCIIGGEIENTYIGTAPKADFLLLRSEDATNDSQGIQNEYLVEEDNWISAAEFADSSGVDVINTSLGYNTFNNPEQDHTYADMNGKTTRISRAAELAAAKGMIVVVSAGNEGADFWKYISAPADAENILTVGAINANLSRAPFSSVGPTSDNRIKPDVMAIGQGTIFQSINNTFISGSGTSFSAPIITGLTACLWQAASSKTNIEIINAIRQSSSIYKSPNTKFGYGIPDFKKALFLLDPFFDHQKGLMIYPNPFTASFNIAYKTGSSTNLKVEIYNTAGKKIYNRDFPLFQNTSGEIEITDLSSIPRGIVIIKVITGDNVITSTAIKL